jgi:hypothetical protein
VWPSLTVGLLTHTLGNPKPGSGLRLLRFQDLINQVTPARQRLKIAKSRGPDRDLVLPFLTCLSCEGRTRSLRPVNSMFPSKQFVRSDDPNFSYVIVVGRRQNLRGNEARRNPYSCSVGISIRTFDYLTDELLSRRFSPFTTAPTADPLSLVASDNLDLKRLGSKL